jgi:hypothetical protein
LVSIHSARDRLYDIVPDKRLVWQHAGRFVEFLMTD